MTNVLAAAFVRARALFDGRESSPRFDKRGCERIRASQIKFEDVTMDHRARHSLLASP
jgi:hypothetical protein